MKKLVTTCLVLLATTLASADLYQQNRWIEFGLSGMAGASNSYFSITDVLKTHVVIDLRKIAEEMPQNGWNLDAVIDARAFFNLNFGRHFRLGFFSGVEGSGNVHFSNDLFALLGKGYNVGESKDFKIQSNGDIFAVTGFSFATRLYDFGITVTPAYVVPIVHIAEAMATVSFTNHANGYTRVEARAPVDIYTIIDMGDNDDGSTSEQISTAVRNGGFDLSLAVERQVLRTLDVGMSVRIPIVPGHLHYRMETNMYARFTESNMLGFLEGTEEQSYEHGVDDVVYSCASVKVHRPFRLGTEAAWRPFGKWMVFRQELALVVRNPYTSDSHVYPEYSLSAECSLFNIFTLNTATAYRNCVFEQSLGFMINARLLEIDMGAAFRSADFANSFNYTGAGVFVAVKVGV